MIAYHKVSQMAELDERCYESNVPVKGFHVEDREAAIRFFMMQGGVLRERGYPPAPLGLYLAEDFCVRSPLIDIDAFSFEVEGRSLTIKPGENIQEAYGEIIESEFSINPGRLTIITENRRVSDLVLGVDGIDSIVGMPGASVPHITATYLGQPVDILTGQSG